MHINCDTSLLKILYLNPNCSHHGPNNLFPTKTNSSSTLFQLIHNASPFTIFLQDLQQGHEPYRLVLAIQIQLGRQPPCPRRLRCGFRPERHRRQIWPGLYRHRPLGRPGQPQGGYAPLRRDPIQPTMDCLC